MLKSAAPIPSKPWTDLGCDPMDLIEVVGATLRGENERLERWIGSHADASKVIEMLASRHRVGPYLKASLDGTGAWLALPETARDRLLKSARLQAVAAAECVSHVAGLHALLGRAGCPYLLLKGPELGIRFLGGAEARGYRDLDVLVREKDRKVVCRALEKAGYHRLSRFFLGATASALFNHAVDYSNQGRLLDLHWCVSRMPGLRIDTDGLFARSEPMDLGGTPVQVLSAGDELSVLLISSFADIQRGYLRLQPFVDIVKVSAALPSGEWCGFFADRKKEGTDAICRSVLNLVLSLFSLRGHILGVDPHLPAQTTPREALEVLLPSPRAQKAKQWALPHLPVGPFHYLVWWAVSLPFRLAASHPRFRR